MIPRKLKLMFAVTAAVSWTVVGSAADFTAQVVRALDGDSVVVRHEQKQIEIRLDGIDCPELDQPFGPQAKLATSQRVLGKTVTVKPTGGIDKYRRLLAIVILPDGRNLNQELVRHGCAWCSQKYGKDERFVKLEAEARRTKVGLWADAHPTPPWDWRKAAEEKRSVGAFVPNGVEIVGLLPDPAGRDEGREAVAIGNSTDKPVKLAGWRLRDRGGNVYPLAGEVAAKSRLRIFMTTAAMPLNNDGDSVLLIGPAGVVRSRAVYVGEQVQTGVWITMGK